MVIQEKQSIDIRVKLVIAFCISTMAVLFSGYTYMSFVLIIAIILSRLFQGDLGFVFNKVKKVLWIFILMIFIQSLFIKIGTPLVTIKGLCIITDVGLQRAFEFIFRISIIMVSTTIIMTSNSREIIQGLIQLKLPYELAFMVSISVRFLPILATEMRDSMTAIELRGIDVKKLNIKSKILLYKYLFTPIVLSSINKAKKLSISMECRGFRAYDYRTSIIKLRFSKTDVIMILCSLSLTATIIITYYWG